MNKTILLVLLVSVMMFESLLVEEAFSVSPSFGERKESDNTKDGINTLDGTPFEQEFAADIIEVKYHSTDGTKLEGHILVDNPIRRDDVVNFSYGVGIDSDVNATTGKRGWDYSIVYEGTRDHWCIKYDHFASDGGSIKLEDPKECIELSTFNIKNPLSFSVDLKKIKEPEQYGLTFFTWNHVSKIADYLEISETIKIEPPVVEIAKKDSSWDINYPDIIFGMVFVLLAILGLIGGVVYKKLKNKNSFSFQKYLRKIK